MSEHSLLEVRTGGDSLEVRVEVRPRWPFRLSRRTGLDGVAQVRGGVLHRLLDLGEESVSIRVAQIAPDRVLFGARARRREVAEWGLERMRFALGIDQDLGEFYDRFRADPLIGRSVRANPGLRVSARPDPFEALVWAICEQLIEYERAALIERRLTSRLGRRCPETGLRDSPTAAVLAAQAPALFASLDLSPGRSLTLLRAAKEVASGRVDLLDPDHERGWRRLRRIPGIGSWTIQMLAFTGQGRMDQLPAGDLAYIKLVGRLLNDDPRSRSTEDEVNEFFARFAPWSGLAGLHALRSGGDVSGALAA